MIHSVIVPLVTDSMYGHVKAMSDAIVEGINDIDGVDVSIYQVPETLDSSVLKKLPSMKQTELPVLALEQVDLLKEADGIILGIPTRFGTVPAQIKVGSKRAPCALSSSEFSTET